MRKDGSTLDRRPLLVGEQPSKSGDRYFMFPLSGAVAQRMCEMAGIPPQEDGSRYGVWTWALYDHFECVNLIERHTTTWPARAAVVRARELFLESPRSRPIVCLGRRVQQAFYSGTSGHTVPMATVERMPFHAWEQNQNSWSRENTPVVVTIPHPSGLNRLLNTEHERERCGETLREALRRSGRPLGA